MFTGTQVREKGLFRGL